MAEAYDSCAHRSRPGSSGGLRYRRPLRGEPSRRAAVRELFISLGILLAHERAMARVVVDGRVAERDDDVRRKGANEVGLAEGADGAVDDVDVALLLTVLTEVGTTGGRLWSERLPETSVRCEVENRIESPTERAAGTVVGALRVTRAVDDAVGASLEVGHGKCGGEGRHQSEYGLHFEERGRMWSGFGCGMTIEGGASGRSHLLEGSQR